ncbi:MAG: dephospho-CoA kinase [Rhodospirillales bacterium]|nr:dephospho-CoA kinase [Rhodospirillales bacterium]
MVVLGLTGSIGMGKTTVANALKNCGAAVYNADAAVHRLLAPGGAAVGPVLARFPDSASGEGAARAVDRGALGAHVFADADALAELEAILHPLVRAGERRFLSASQRRGCRLAVLDVPLLFETGGETRCDATLVVSAPPFVQRARVLGRARMSEERLAAILARQMPDAEKRRRADFVIRTSLDRRVSRRAAQRVAARLSATRGTRWPLCWSGALKPAGEGDHA